jgi:zinc transport system ATP-binding protein
MKTPKLEIKNISVEYHHVSVLDNINLCVFQEDFIGIVGPNGGGKTTLLKTIVGLVKPKCGEIIHNINGAIGYLPQLSQHDRQFPISTEEVVLSGLFGERKIFGRYKKQDFDRIRYWLEYAGIATLSNRNFGSLSGGQRQRVLLCRALVSDPKLLILDEPDTYVDNRFEGELYELLKRLNENIAILVVTHDLGTISSYVKSIACVNRYLHHHLSNFITSDQLEAYNCPIQMIAHGSIPHTVLEKH